MTNRFLATLLIAVLSTPAVFAADKPAEATKPAGKDDGFVSLFNGKDLAGWIVSNCKAGVENGSLVIQEGNGLIRSEKLYGDFVLELEWKNRQAEKFDSGIFIRAVAKKFSRWPAKWQINLLQGQEGSLVGHKDGKALGLAKAGEWNKLQVTCIGKTAEAQVNGKPAWKVGDIEPAVGFVGIQVEVTAGGQFEFRNIRIKPITPPMDEPKATEE
ncbi:3-keto-disaccharide hydrolase [Humisphaera borealis]|uniref:DUF1080 domain-containing protein n=1 Tax=Humisphaera borealis TaxID=2807512 RepID=A0A7M2WS71_9BACT|nr:DUF1080 domain-containing protein [Humisphaera borealis]QOV88259.1 DUF1080 domain-containing protein [Humisphaera borealis]